MTPTAGSGTPVIRRGSTGKHCSAAASLRITGAASPRSGHYSCMPPLRKATGPSGEIAEILEKSPKRCRDWWCGRRNRVWGEVRLGNVEFRRGALDRAVGRSARRRERLARRYSGRSLGGRPSERGTRNGSFLEMPLLTGKLCPATTRLGRGTGVPSSVGGGLRRGGLGDLHISLPRSEQRALISRSGGSARQTGLERKSGTGEGRSKSADCARPTHPTRAVTHCSRAMSGLWLGKGLQMSSLGRDAR